MFHETYRHKKILLFTKLKITQNTITKILNSIFLQIFVFRPIKYKVL